MTPHKIAIIIPAYKSDFLHFTLDSIARQTCKDFVLYIGDDASPYPIMEIVNEYKSKMEIVYKRFEKNIGGMDLVAQWERCIALSSSEPYIWLFSDDDILPDNCVEELVKQIDITKGYYDLYHFDVNIIDEEGKVIDSKCDYPDVLSSYDYYKGKISGRYPSYVVENIFTRAVYNKYGGFKNFDLAWGSDTATWSMFCGVKGMCKVSTARVCWRRSSQNISPNISQPISERKIMSVCSFLEWSYSFFINEEDIFNVNRKMFVNRMRQFKNHISKPYFKKAFALFFETHGHKGYKLLTYLEIVL